MSEMRGFIRPGADRRRRKRHEAPDLNLVPQRPDDEVILDALNRGTVANEALNASDAPAETPGDTGPEKSDESSEQEN